MSVERACDEEYIRNKIISFESLKRYRLQDFQCVRKIYIVYYELTVIISFYILSLFYDNYGT